MKKILFVLILFSVGCSNYARVNGELVPVSIEKRYNITQYTDDGKVLNEYYIEGKGNFEIFIGGPTRIYFNDKYIWLTGTIKVEELEPKVEELE